MSYFKTKVYYDKIENTLSWVYNSDYWYWTMSSVEDSTSWIWTVAMYGSLGGRQVFANGSRYSSGIGVVRPVILISKSALN